jgi:CRISP-associated protein Cas1
VVALNPGFDNPNGSIPAFAAHRPATGTPEVPDYLPARMVNEYVYCPRLFFYEFVDGLFQESVDTVEGSTQHKRVDRGTGALQAPAEGAGGGTARSRRRGKPDASTNAGVVKSTSDSDGEEEAEVRIHSRSVTLSSETLRVIAKMDLIEVTVASGDGQAVEVTPVDYKHGRPREVDPGVSGGSTLGLWPTDRVQLAIQGLILRENGYRCEEAVAYYQKTKQRVRVALTPEVLQEAETAVQMAWQTAQRGVLPRPLVDSPKCPGCSMVGICLPDETNWLLRKEESGEAEWDAGRQLHLFEESPAERMPLGHDDPGTEESDWGQQARTAHVKRTIRQLIAARQDAKAVYLNTPGLRVGKSGEVLQVKDKDSLVQEVRMNEICQVNLMGNIQITTQATQALCEAGVPVCYFSMGGWFYGISTGMNTKNIFLRRTQFRLADSEGFCVQLAKRLVAGKVRNHRVMLQRNHIEPNPVVLTALKQMAEAAESAESLGTLLGIEGNAARLYFGEFAGMIKSDGVAAGAGPGVEEEDDFGGEVGERQRGEAMPTVRWNTFDFTGRNRRPPRDPVNALLSLAYSVLSKDMTVACYAVGFDPLMGYYHQPRFGRPALALDLMEPFRPLIAESAVLSAINTRMVTLRDFVKVGRHAVALTPGGRKGFFRAYEARMDTLVTHPMFEYRVTYRRLLEIQARLLARVLEGDILEYPVFVTR